MKGLITMGTTMNDIADQATAIAVLHRVRDELADATGRSDDAMAALRNEIIRIRPTGLMDVNDMAETIGQDRNYVDRTWSIYRRQVAADLAAKTLEGVAEQDAKMTWKLLDHDDAQDRLASVAATQRVAESAKNTARAERDRVVVLVYASKILGPSAIAAASDIDRNHVLRLARKAGVAAQHRKVTRNQYSAGAQGKHSANAPKPSGRKGRKNTGK